jgi:predicted nucleic acid-binding protein
MKLLDTDHCISILRGRLDLNTHVSPQDELATTAISVAELIHGAHRSQHSEDNLARLEVLLSVLIILPFDEAAGRRFGELKANLEARGEPLDNLDLQIASIAIENNCQLHTKNRRHFARINGLKLMNWLE